MSSFRERLGCWLKERWKLELALLSPAIAGSIGLSWLDLCNRHEKLEVDRRTGGRRCLWQDSSPLTVSRLYPSVGGRLFHHCFDRWTVRFHESIENEESVVPDISFVLGVRGTERLSQFQTCVASLCGQVGVNAEIIVVEQSSRREYDLAIAPGVRYVFQQVDSSEVPYNRSWSLNGGVRIARAPIVVLADSDMVFPERFAATVAQRMQAGLEYWRPVRLLFYLDADHSAELQQQRQLSRVREVDRVVGNAPNPIAVRRSAYWKIGGHDEAFRGWGGEDNEFVSRLRTLDGSEGGVMPLIHLWHKPASGRVHRPNDTYLNERLAMSTADRIRDLRSRMSDSDRPTGVAMRRP